jgi:hypothetical protein
LSYVVPVKSKLKILQNFVAFSEYMNFIINNEFLFVIETILTRLVDWQKQTKV